MRICFVTVMDIKLPTMKRATGLAEPLIQAGHEVAIISWETDANKERYAYECPNVEPIWIPVSKSALKDAFRKWQAIRSWKPDLVYVCAFGVRNFVIKQIFGRKGSRRPVVVIEHSELASSIQNLSLPKRMLMGLLEKISVWGADGLLCASPFLTEFFSAQHSGNLPTGYVLYFPYAYNSMITEIDKEQYSGILAKRNDDKLHILYMGTLAINYGILDILNAVKIMRGKRTDFVLHVLGAGRHAQQARQCAEELEVCEYVQFEGFVPEEALGAWFSIADVFVAPLKNTIQDKARCPSKVYMYLPFKKPVVTCAIGDPHHTLGEDGFYYEPGNSDELSEQLDRALTITREWQPLKLDVVAHSWDARATQFLGWCSKCGWLQQGDRK